MKIQFYEEKMKYEEKYNEEFNKTGVFWAFSNQQFEENKTHKEAPDSEYISVGAGGYIHKSNKEKLDNFFKVILPKLKKEFINKIDIDNLIEYELINHECYYTGEWHEIIDIIKSYVPNIKKDRIKKVYDKTKDKH